MHWSKYLILFSKILNHPFFFQQFDSSGKPIKDIDKTEARILQDDVIDDLKEENSVVEPDEEEHLNGEMTDGEMTVTDRNFKVYSVEVLAS